jgi:hypothetical protein
LLGRDQVDRDAGDPGGHFSMHVTTLGKRPAQRTVAVLLGQDAQLDELIGGRDGTRLRHHHILNHG